MNLRLYLGVVLFTVFCPRSPAAEVIINSRLTCDERLNERVEAVLKDTLPRLTSGKSIHAEVGVLNDLPVLLSASGLRDRKVKLSMALFAYLLAHNSVSSILQNTSGRLSKVMDDEKALVTCVLEGECRLRYGDSLHAVHGEPGWLESSGDSPPDSFPALIVINGGKDTEPTTLIMGLINAATHFADFELVSEWLIANRELQNFSEPPDALFTKYARVTDGGRFQVDEGFMRVFLESRATAAEIQIFAKVIPVAEYLKFSRSKRFKTMRAIRSYHSATGHIVENLKLSEMNIFEIGENFGETMTATIERWKKHRQ